MNLKILYILLFFQMNAQGQILDFNKMQGISYTNKEGDFFYLLNDSTLVSNLNSNGDTAKYAIFMDTIFSYQNYKLSQDGREWVEAITHYFVFNHLENDTIKMVAYGFYDRNNHKEKVNYTFVNNKLLEKEVDKFEYIIIERISPFWGYNKLKFRVDSVVEFYIDMKNVAVNYMQIDTARTIKPSKRTISTSDYAKLKLAVTKAKIITWPINRYNCHGTDRCDINITLKANSKFYYSLGCTTPYQFNHLMEIFDQVLDRFIVYNREQ